MAASRSQQTRARAGTQHQANRFREGNGKMKENRKYFVQQFLQEEYQHGGVGGTDAEKVLLSLGYSPIVFPHHHSFSPGAKIGRLVFLLKVLWTLPKNSDRKSTRLNSSHVKISYAVF